MDSKQFERMDKFEEEFEEEPIPSPGDPIIIGKNVDWGRGATSVRPGSALAKRKLCNFLATGRPGARRRR